MRVISLQIDVPDEESKSQRLTRIERLIEGLPEADLILLPEAWHVGYFCFDRYREQSEDLAGETVGRMAALARRRGAYILAGSIIQPEGEHLYNTTVLLDRSGQVLATYRKIHLFGYGSQESKLLQRGNDVVTARTEFGVVGLSTCYDLRFPELYRRMIDDGAEFFLIPSAWPFPRLHHWQALNVARAVENEAYLISCNCAGPSRGQLYLGHSMIVDPWGAVVAAAGDRPGVVEARLDPDLPARVRAEFPPLRDRVLRI